MPRSAQDELVPARPRICTTCRRLYGADEVCDAGRHHQLVALDQPGAIGPLFDAVWPERDVVAVRPARTVARLTGWGTTALIGLAIAIWRGAPVITTVPLVVVALLPVTIMVIVALEGRDPVALRTLRRRTRRPTGSRRAAGSPSGPALLGRVVASQVMRSPLTETACCAYAVELTRHDARHGPVLLADAATIGFEVELNDGRRISIPAGRLVLAPEPVAVRASARQVDDYLVRVSGWRAPTRGATPFPHDRTRELLVRDGDVVVVRGPFATEIGAAAYREAPDTTLIPEAVPTVEVVGTP